MKTVKLKSKKKKQILWNRLFILLAIVFVIFIYFYLFIDSHIGYKYYIIDENQNKIVLGKTFKDNIDTEYV